MTTLEQLLPAEAVFHVERTKKTYTLRKIGLRDHIWFAELVGGADAAKKALRSRDLMACTQYVYRLLTQDDRKDFPARTVLRVDDEGEERDVKLTGPQVLLESLIDVGPDHELNRMLAALTKAITDSSPIVEKPAPGAPAEKKTTDNPPPQTGATSSTPSQASTGTPSTPSAG